jgi:hypothetical protein
MQKVTRAFSFYPHSVLIGKTCEPYPRKISLSASALSPHVKNVRVIYVLFLGGISVPTGVFLDSSLNVYVSEYSNYRITKWTPGNTASGTVVAGGNGLSVNLNSFQTSGIYVGLLGEIYVPDLSKLY